MNKTGYPTKAPWPCHKGNALYVGDAIRHPSGECGVIVYCNDGDKGQTVKI